MSEFLDTPKLSRLLASLNLDTSFTIEEISGGFTASEKYVIRDSDTAPVSFIKVVDKTADSDELAAITAEIVNYQLLNDLHLTGGIFPTVHRIIDADDYLGIVMDYYENATWGGPWNDDSIRAVYRAFSEVHATPLTDDQRHILQKTKDSFIPMAKIYDEGFPAIQDRVTIVNSRGQILFTAPDDLLYRALFEDEKIPDNEPPVLIVQDANKYNVCLDREGNAHIVDPVYINIGNPYQDLLNIGNDIIRSLPEDSPDIQTIKSLFRPSDRRNPHVLNNIAYGLSASQKPYEDNPKWMDYQEQSLLTNLRLWYDQL